MKHLLLTLLLVVTTLLCNGQPGLPDSTFNPTDTGHSNGDGANGAVHAIALQANGSIFIGGDFTTYNGTALNRIAQLKEDGSLAPYFNSKSSKANSTIHALALQSDGKVLAGGTFNDYNGNWYHDHLTRLNPNGSLDAYFNNGSGVNGTPGGANGPVYTIAVGAENKILIGGWFQSYNNTPRNFIARLDREGLLDPTFDPGSAVPGAVTTLAVQGDGKILLAGTYTDGGGTTRHYLTRLNANGSPDATFNSGSGVNAPIHALALLSDGKILIAGSFTTYNGITRNRIARLNSNGVLDASFSTNTGANGPIQALAVQPDGRILIGGDFTSYRSTARNRIARLTSNGNLDATFDPGSGVNQSVYALALTPDGKIYIGGSFSSCNGTSRNRIARLLSDGSLDISFNRGTGARGPVLSVSLQSDSKIIIGGDFTTYNGITRNYLARLNSDGILDASFDPGSGADTAVLATAVQSDGRILAAGAFTTFNGMSRNRIARLNLDGSLDASFTPGSGANSFIHTIVPQSDGRILIGGAFTSFNNTIRFRVARLNSNGTLDATFNPGGGPNGTVTTMALQADGKVLIGGTFTAYDGVSRNYLARLNADGTLDASFKTGSGANYPVSAVALQADGKVLIGGSFTYFNGVARNQLARLNADGSLDASFNPGSVASGSVATLAVQSDGRILVGSSGTFTNNATYSIDALARLHWNGALDASFNSPGGGANSTVCAVVLQSDGRILIGGQFTAYNHTGRNRLARLQSGSNDLSLGVIKSLSYCAGMEVSIPFTAIGVYSQQNTFTAELSGPSGSFTYTSQPQYIGYLAGTTSGTIVARFPHNLPSGTGYRVRVVSSSPYVTSPDNGYNLTVSARPHTPYIDAPGDTTFCAGSSITLTASATLGVQWYKDGVAISGATSRTYEISQAGLYSVTTTQNNCTSEMSPVVMVSAKPLPAKPVINQEGYMLSTSAIGSLQWYKDGMPITGAASPQYEARATGQYSVAITQGGCSAHSDAVSVVLTAIVAPTTWNGEVSVYPVPVQDVLYVANADNRRLSIQLLDVAGKRVCQTQSSSVPACLSLKDLAPGTYLLLITDLKTGRTISRPIVKI